MTTEEYLLQRIEEYGKHVENQTLARVYIHLKDKPLTIKNLAEAFDKTPEMINRTLAKIRRKEM